MQYRPYQYEKDKINLYNSLEAFNQKHHYQNKKVNNINNYNNVDSYFKDFCASDCKHFIIKKIN